MLIIISYNDQHCLQPYFTAWHFPQQLSLTGVSIHMDHDPMENVGFESPSSIRELIIQLLFLCCHVPSLGNQKIIYWNITVNLERNFKVPCNSKFYERKTSNLRFRHYIRQLGMVYDGISWLNLSKEPLSTPAFFPLVTLKKTQQGCVHWITMKKNQETAILK